MSGKTTIQFKVSQQEKDKFVKVANANNKLISSLLREFVTSYNDGTLRIEKSEEELKQYTRLYTKKQED